MALICCVHVTSAVDVTNEEGSWYFAGSRTDARLAGAPGLCRSRLSVPEPQQLQVSGFQLAVCNLVAHHCPVVAFHHVNRGQHSDHKSAT